MLVAGLDLVVRLQLDEGLEVAEVEPARHVALGLRDRGAEAVVLVDDAEDVRLARDDDVEILPHHLAVELDRLDVERVDHRDEELPVLHRERHHLVAARERARDLLLDELDVELERVDFVESLLRVLGDEAREEEVVDLGLLAGRVGQVQRHDRLERAHAVVAAASRGAGRETRLLVERIEVLSLFVVDEPRLEEQVPEIGDGDLRRALRLSV